MSGLVLKSSDTHYGDMTTIGRIEIERDTHTGQVRVMVNGFEFADPPTCRMHSIKAMAWARDLLASMVETGRLVPGGDAQASIGL